MKSRNNHRHVLCLFKAGNSTPGSHVARLMCTLCSHIASQSVFCYAMGNVQQNHTVTCKPVVIFAMSFDVVNEGQVHRQYSKALQKGNVVMHDKSTYLRSNRRKARVVFFLEEINISFLQHMPEVLEVLSFVLDDQRDSRGLDQMVHHGSIACIRTVLH